MENISIETVKTLLELLNPKVVKSVGNILRYYSSIHIENRNDTNCLKVLFFIRNKILYNFLNEHIDSLSFIQNCFNISKEEFKNFYNNEINAGLTANVEEKKQFNIFYSFLTFICIGVVSIVVIAVIHFKFE